MVVLAISATSVAAAPAQEAWNCNYSGPLSTGPTAIRFQISGERLIEGQFRDGYRIVQNNEYGLIATLAISQAEKDQQQPTVGAVTVVINKGTGSFGLPRSWPGSPAR
jgi:hypothetical protein